MATPDVSIRIGAELKEFKSALNQVKQDIATLTQQSKASASALGGTESAIRSIADSTRTAGTLVKSLISGFAALQTVRAFAALVQQGIEFNKTLETAELGIASLIAAQTDLVDSQGKAVTGQDALTVAIGLSKQQMRELRIAGLETAATTTQLVEAFQQAVGPGLTAGLNLDEVRQVTISIVQAAGALGVPMNQISQEVRTILDGTIDINARVAKSLGLTNEQVNTWKQQGTLVEELNKRLGAFADAGKRAADTFEVIASNTQEAFQSVSGEVTKGFFDNIKEALKNATSGIFDVKTLGISDAFKDLSGIVSDVITLIGEGIGNAITGVVSLAQEFSGYVKQNRADLDELIQSVAMLLDQFGQLVGSVAEIVLGISDAGVKTSAFSKILQTVAVLIAGVRDGFRAIGSVVTWLGSLIIKVVLAPIETLLALVSQAVGLVNKKAAAQLKSIEKQVAGVSARGFQAAKDLMQPIADGNGAVATAIKQIGKLKDAAAKAGQQQKAAADGGANGSIKGIKPGLNQGKVKAVDIPDLTRQLDESFRLQADALKRESDALDKALEDRKVTISQWYEQKAALAEKDYQNSKAQLEKERADLVAQLAKVQALKPQKDGDQEKIDKATLKVKNDLAKVDADLIILDRQRTTEATDLARKRKQAEDEYRKAVEDTRIALMRARGQDLEAQLAEIARARDERRKILAGDQKGLDLTDQLFNAETAKARFDDLKRQFDRIIEDARNRQQNIANQVQTGALSSDTGEAQMRASRQQTIDQLGVLTQKMRELAIETNNPAIVQGAEAATLALQNLAIEGATGLDAALIKLRSSLENLKANMASNVIDSAAAGLTQFFTDIATGSKSAGDALRDLVRGFVAALARMAAEALAKQAILSIFGMFGGGGGAVGAAVHHSGGMAGAGMTRNVSPLLFVGAPRFHSGGMVGLAPNEVPAILQQGERVLNRQETAAYNGGKGSGFRVVNVIDPSLVEDYMTSSAGERTILNTIGRNPGYVKQIIGG